MSVKHLAGIFDSIDRTVEDEKRVKKHENKIKNLDIRYDGIANYILLQLNKRNVSIKDKNFDKNLEDITNAVLNSKLFKDRFYFDNQNDIKNAVRRRLNAELNREKQGYSRDE